MNITLHGVQKIELLRRSTSNDGARTLRVTVKNAYAQAEVHDLLFFGETEVLERLPKAASFADFDDDADADADVEGVNQHEHLPPAGYVQAAPVIQHGDRIAQGIETMVLAAEEWPGIIRALNLIRENSGGPSWPPESDPRIACRWTPYLNDIETALAALSDDAPAPEDGETIARLKDREFCYIDSELYTFCNGEDTLVEIMAERSFEMTAAHNFLSDFFWGWSLYSDDDFNPMATRSKVGETA